VSFQPQRSSGSAKTATAQVAELYGLAVGRHQAGFLQEAEGLYRRVLAIDQKHANSMYNLGLLGLQIGRTDFGVKMIAKAIARNNRVPEWHYNLAFGLAALGQNQEAIAHYRKAVTLKPAYAEAHMNLGNALKVAGQLDQAIASYQRVIALQPEVMEAHCNVANVLAEQGQWERAAESYERALALDPSSAQAHTNYGIVLSAQGKQAEAVARHQRALALNPNLIEAYVNLGKVLASEGKHEEAAAQYRQALARNPDYAQAHNNLGVVLMADGQVDAAIASYHRALALRPDLSEVLNNLGVMFLAKGQNNRAAECLRRAITQRPDFVDAHNNLARACMAERDVSQALRVLMGALAIRETAETKTLFVACLKGMRTLPAGQDYRDLVVRALAEPWGRPSDLAHVAAHLIMQNPAIGVGVARALDAWPERLPIAAWLPSATRAAIARDEVLRALLENGRVAHVELERFLTALRFALLGLAADGTEANVIDADELRLFCALARHCFDNDYVFDATERECAQAEILRQRLVAALEANAEVPVLWPVAVAAYFPLHSLPAVAAFMRRSWPEAVVRLLQQQVVEPEQERLSAASITRLTAIEDDVSLRVQEQYEQNPYPRWAKPAPAPNPTTVDEYLRGRLPLSAFRPLGKSRDVNVLIAGCGTGQHSIEAARHWKGVRLLAVDLSLKSLSYAKRQTNDLDLNNIEYAHADILELGSIGRSFDVIEAAGVVHHLADPNAGWRVLSSLLRPGGMLFLGLYSEVARRDIVAARTFIAERGYRATAEDIRRCRQELMDAEDGTPLKNVTQTSDFGSTSECRDLLFHAQEHRTTLPAIKAALVANQLTFLGFEIDSWVRRQYAVRFPDDSVMTDLDRWHEFEMENPLTFVRMYQFWAQKA
jgi:tetratricopeptide (TPR) repeat protein/2-polyprenyl-3-methyl-5-hydroxy-6-metoxy-1,4-benzoquinol methylase